MLLVVTTKPPAHIFSILLISWKVLRVIYQKFYRSMPNCCCLYQPHHSAIKDIQIIPAFHMKQFHLYYLVKFPKCFKWMLESGLTLSMMLLSFSPSVMYNNHVANATKDVGIIILLLHTIYSTIVTSNQVLPAKGNMFMHKHQN